MNTHFSIAVKDILTRKHFENCELVAGELGLDRMVKWIHVFEVTEVGDLLNGDELILSTGSGWREDESKFISLVKQLINCNAAGLCIEVGKYVKGVSDEVKDIANKNGFPILLFNSEVPFVEITQDIHSYLINKHYEMITNLEGYAHRLNKKLLSINNDNEILKFLQRFLNLQVVYYSDSNEYRFIPEMSEKNKREMINKITKNLNNDFHVLSQHVQVLEREYAKVFLISTDRELGEFESLILDRTVTALAQHLLKVLYIEEKKKAEETEWILEWLMRGHNVGAVREHLSFYKGSENFKGAVVCIFRLNNNDNQHKTTDSTFLKMMVQTTFDQKDFLVFMVEKRNNFVVILINKGNINDWKVRVNKCLTKLMNHETPSFSTINFSIGQYVNNLSNVNKSYDTAKETLNLQIRLEENKKKCFFEDLHMYRIISLVHKHSDLNEFVDEYLGPIINYDRQHNGNLMETLKAYLECNGSKKETAKKIFVVRQTLYHRIEKLERLLGEDFMMPEKRQAFEFSILASGYLESVKELDDV